MEAAAAAPAPGGGPGTLLFCLALASVCHPYGSHLMPCPIKRDLSPLPWVLLQQGLTFCSCVGADTNVTAGQGTEGLTCGTDESCTGNVTQLRQHSHFSRCPEEYRHYCVKGRCRFLVAEKAPACVCERGYTGARCERVDIFYLRGDRGQIVIISLIAAVVTLIVLIVCACLCSHHCRKQRRKRKAEEMETLNKNSPSKSEDVLETGIV